MDILEVADAECLANNSQSPAIDGDALDKDAVGVRNKDNGRILKLRVGGRRGIVDRGGGVPYQRQSIESVDNHGFIASAGNAHSVGAALVQCAQRRIDGVVSPGVAIHCDVGRLRHRVKPACRNQGY